MEESEDIVSRVTNRIHTEEVAKGSVERRKLENVPRKDSLRSKVSRQPEIERKVLEGFDKIVKTSKNVNETSQPRSVYATDAVKALQESGAENVRYFANSIAYTLNETEYKIKFLNSSTSSAKYVDSVSLDEAMMKCKNDRKAKQVQMEEKEPLEELSKKTLGSYAKKAQADIVKGGVTAGVVASKKKTLTDKEDGTTKILKKGMRRMAGQQKAIEKLSENNEHQEISTEELMDMLRDIESTQGVNESEQLDELSKGLLKKAASVAQGKANWAHGVANSSRIGDDEKEQHANYRDTKTLQAKKFASASGEKGDIRTTSYAGGIKPDHPGYGDKNNPANKSRYSPDKYSGQKLKMSPRPDSRPAHVFPFNESEQLDELSVDTLRSYIDKASPQALGYGFMPTTPEESDAAWKRSKFVLKAHRDIEDRTNPIMDPQIHDLSSMSDGEAYDHTQYTDDVKDGDILKLNGNRLAIMYSAWPTMHTGDSDIMHHLSDGGEWSRVKKGRYAASDARARDIAQTHFGEEYDVIEVSRASVIEEAKKPVDDSDDESKETDLNIVTQLRKAADTGLRPTDLKFADGSNLSISRSKARVLLSKIMGMKPADRMKALDSMGKSADGVKGMLGESKWDTSFKSDQKKNDGKFKGLDDNSEGRARTQAARTRPASRDELVDDPDFHVRRSVAIHGTDKHLDKLVNDKNKHVLIAVAERGNKKHLDKLVDHDEDDVRRAVARAGGPEHLDALKKDKDTRTRTIVARRIDKSKLKDMKDDPSSNVQSIINHRLGKK